MEFKFLSKLTIVVVLMSLFVQTSNAQIESFGPNGTNTDKSTKDETVHIGDGSSPCGSYNYPVDFYGQTSVSQTIYTKAEIGHEDGLLINKLEYTYKTVNSNITDDPIDAGEFRVWLYNTTDSLLTEEAGYWLPYDKFTLVFEGALSLPAGENKKMTIELPDPYVYNGENLCIMVERVHSEVTYPNHFDFVASTLSGKSRVYNQNTPMNFEYMIDSSNYHGMTLGQRADIDIYTMDAEDISISGEVTIHNTTTPIIGAKVEILNTDLVCYTDSLGKYAFPILLEGDKTVRFSSFGYVTKDTVVTVNSDITLDVSLDSLKTATLNGKIVDKDNNPLKGAEILITGYESHSAVSGDDGTFSVEDMLIADNYTLIVNKRRYISDTITFNVTSTDDVQLEDISLFDVLREPSLVEAEVDENSVVSLSWVAPTNIIDYRYDGGQCVNGIGHINGEVAVMGCLFNEPAKLFRATWFRYGDNDGKDSLNLFVFKLNASQEIDNVPIFLKKVYTNKIGWSEYIFEDTLKVENGFLLAVSGRPSDLSLGIDAGENADYPFIPEANYISLDYLTGNGNFLPIEEALTLPGNFMIRGEGYNLETGEKLGNASKALNEYKIYRLQKGYEEDSTKWTYLTTTTELNYTDSEFANQPQGWYRYAVIAVFSGDKTSNAAFSNVLGKETTTEITLNVTTNAGISAQGAEVMLRNKADYEYTYKGVIDENGKVVFEDVLKGTYTVGIDLKGFTSIFEENVDFTTNATYSKDYELIEKLEKPKNLAVMYDAQEENGDVTLYWNLTKTIFDNIDSYENFELNPTGDIEWTYLDLDQNPTTTITGLTFENQGSPCAFMVFTPEATTPSIDVIAWPGLKPHSGKSYLMGFGYEGKTNNDFIISPELKFIEDFNFSFFAKSFSTENFSKFKVGYSTTSNTNVDEFIWLTETPVEPIGGPEFTEYSYVVPKEAKYVFINHISEGQKLLMLDDIRITKSSKNSKSLTNYKVYLDGSLLGETTDSSYVLNKPNPISLDGEHTAAVEAVYSTGTSEKATIKFNLSDDNEEIAGQNTGLYPIPANNFVTIIGEFESYEVYDITGKLVLNGNLSNNQINISELNDGVYAVKLINNNVSVNRKIVVKH